MATFDVRRHNVAALLLTLLKEGPAPRVDLAERLSLSSGTTTRITAELTRAGLLQELPSLASGDAGRPRVPLDLASARFHAVGIHVGLRRTTVGLVDLRGRPVGDKVRIAHRGELDPAVVVGEAAKCVADLVQAASAQIVGTGFTTVGRVDAASGRIHAHDMLGWTDVDIPALAAGRFPGLLVVESTQRALCRAEMWFGVDPSVRDFVHLFIGNVIGAGIVIDRELHHGHNEGAGNIAHLQLSRPAQSPCECGRGGCLMSVAGDRALVGRALREGVLTEERSVHDLAERARSGDALADYLLRDRARAIGEAVAIVHDLLAPDQIIVFGTPLLVPDHITEIRREARRWMRRDFDADQLIKPSALGDDDAPVVAAATCILERFYADPFALIG
ncbi:ROK family transcriptional regulator [Nonomuraea sp. B1E8]|uniref:ROK family transcriptional regulator n=1 Tax=unclassified Nonomuraea TaxID=2593643 RepID=UPI00325E99C0